MLRQFESLPRPLVSEQACELLATLPPPYDLMARWQLYTGLRISELLRLRVQDVTKRSASSSSASSHHTIEVTRKGRKPGYVIAPASLLDETAAYQSGYRRAWLLRARRRGRSAEPAALFVNARGSPVGKNAYQRVISRTGQACGFKATTHLLRATFACMLLARLERLASEGAAINPLMIVKVLMGHERIETTDRYLRAIAVDAGTLKGVSGHAVVGNAMTMVARRRPMPREFASSADVVDGGASSTCYEAPRLVRRTVVDFGSLGLPADVRRALAEAFWCHFGVMAERCIHMRWHYVNVFDRFARESGAITSLADVHGGMLVRYVEWLNAQCRPDGQPWTKSSRASAYTILRKLLQWIERCRPGVIACIEYPFNPFPWRNRDGRSRSKMPAGELRALLRACEADIARIRAGREAAAAQRIADAGKPGTLGWLLEHIDRRCGGIVPTARELSRAGQHPIQHSLAAGSVA